MRLSLIPLFFFFTFSLFAQTPEITHLNEVDGIHSVDISKVNGVWEGVTTFYENGKVQRTVTYHQGKKNGPETEYNASGRTIAVSFYKDDLPDSVWITWYDDGRLKSESNFSLGHRNGVFRVFYHDGHEQLYAYYNMDVGEGRYLEKDDRNLVMLEGFLRHGEWVWFRRFCDWADPALESSARQNKLCESGGMDTLTGKTWRTYYDERGYVASKLLTFPKDSFLCRYAEMYEGDEVLVSRSTEMPEANGYFYRRQTEWWDGDTTRPAYVFTDSCTFADYFSWRKNGTRVQHSRYDCFFRNGELRIASEREGAQSHWAEYDTLGRVREEGMLVNEKREGRWTGGFPGDSTSWLRRRSYYNGGTLVTDSVFYPDGKAMRIFRRDERYGTSYDKTYYPSGQLQSDQTYWDASTYSCFVFYANGEFCSKVTASKRFGRYGERSEKFYPGGKKESVEVRTRSVFGSKQRQKIWYTNGKLRDKRAEHDHFSLVRFRHVAKVRYKTWYFNGHRNVKQHYTCIVTPDLFKRFISGKRKYYDENGKHVSTVKPLPY